MQTLKRWLPYVAAIAVIAAVALGFFWPDAIEGNTLSQYDMRQGAANGQELVEYKAETGQTARWTNSLFGGMPAFQISPSYPSTALLSWINSLYGLFLPSPANLLAMMMIGMFILLLALGCRKWISLTGAVAWGLSSYFVIIIGAGHLWKFITLAYVPPTIAGLVMIYNGRRVAGAGVASLFMALQIASNHLQMSYYFAWVMAGFVIAYGVSALKAKQMGKWGVDTAILAGAMLLAVAANAPNLYHTYEYSKQTMRGQHSELTAETEPEQSTGGLDRDYITMYSYERGETFSLLIPNINGGASAMPVKGQVMPSTLADSDEGKTLMRQKPEMTLLQLFSPYFGGPEGTNGPVYVGALIVALFVFGCVVVKNPLKWVLLVLTLLSIFLAWGRNMQWLTDLFIDYMPGYSKFRTVESILVIAEFTIPVLAMLGLKELLTAKEPKKLLKPLLWSFGATAAVCLLALVAPGLFGNALLGERDMQTIGQYIYYGALPEDFNITAYPGVLQAVESMRHGMVKADALRSLFIIALGLTAILFYLRGKAGRAAVIAVVGVVTLVDLFSADRRYLNHDSFTKPQAQAEFTPSAADAAILTDSDPNYRVLDVTAWQRPEPSYFHKHIGGYHAAKLTRYQDLMDRHLNYVARPEVEQLMTLRDDSVAAPYDPRTVQAVRAHLNVMDMLNTKYVIINPDAAPLLNTGAMGNAWFVDRVDYVGNADEEMAALDTINPRHTAVADRAFEAALCTAPKPSPTDRIALTSYAPDRLTYSYSAAGERIAVFSEVYFPWGWKATVDGEEIPIGRVDYLLRALRLPAGQHEVVMEFRPRSVTVTDTLATIAIIMTYLLLAAAIIVAIKRK